MELREKPTSTSKSSFTTSTLKFRQPDCHPDIQKLVRARVLDPQACGARVFESEKEALNEKRLVIEDVVAEPDENRYVTLAIHNCSLPTVREPPYCQHIFCWESTR